MNKLYLIRANELAEKNLQQSNLLLQSRNKDLEQFAYVASHDLQEPLRTIASYVELLSKRYASSFDKNGAQYMGYVLQSTHRLKKLIKDLLDYSRIGREGTMQYVNLNLLLQGVEQDLHQQIFESGAVVEATALPIVKGHATDLSMLLQNLISNAVKFRQKSVLPFISISAEEGKEFATFSVKDNGIGMEQLYLERIFIIFQRLHNQSEYEGTGIGLAHCKK